MFPTIFVLLPVHDRRATTEAFVRALRAQTYPFWHLILLDDGSADDTAQGVRELVPDATILRGNGSWWWGGALHEGCLWLRTSRALSDDVVLFINDDTEIERDFLKNAVAVLAPNSLLLAQQYTMQERTLAEVGVEFDWKHFTHATTNDPRKVNCYPTRGLFLHMKDLINIGTFRPILLPHYLADYEFTMRAHRKGFALSSDPSVRIFFDEQKTGMRLLAGRTFRERLRSAFSKRYMLNPIYISSFIFLACPKRYIPLNLARLWKGFVRDLLASPDDGIQGGEHPLAPAEKLFQ